MLKRLWSDHRNVCLITLALLVISVVVSPWVLLAAVVPVGWIIFNQKIKTPTKNLFNQLERTRESLIEIAVEAWRLSKAFESLLNKSSLEEKRKYEGKLIWFQKKLNETLEKLDIRLVNIENKKYDLGMAVKAINLDDFNESDHLYINKMLEPIIIGENGVIKIGTVTLARAK